MKINNFMFNDKQMKMNKFIKYIWKWIISTLNATLEVPILQVINLYGVIAQYETYVDI